MTALAQNFKRTFRMPNCDGRVCRYAASARARGFSAGEVKTNRPLSYIFNYVGQYGESFTRFFFFFPPFFPAALSICCRCCRVSRGGGGGGGGISVASYASSVSGFIIQRARRSVGRAPIRSFADERSKFIPAGMKFRGVTNSVALSGRR